MTTIRLSWVSFEQCVKLTDVLKLGLPVMIFRERHLLKQLVVVVAFCPNPAGRVRDVREVQLLNNKVMSVAF